MPKKVCHITTVHPPFDVRIFYKECRTLSQNGYDVTLIAQHDRDEIVDGIKIVPLPKVRSRLQRFLGLDILAFWKAMKQRAYIYHFHDPELIPWMLMLKLISKSKVVYDMHEYYSEVIIDRSRWLRKFSFLKGILKIFLEYLPSSFFDLIVFPTFSLEKEIKLSSRSLTLINLPSLQDVSIISEISIPWNQKKYDIIHVGTISPSRMRFMLEVARYLDLDMVKFKWLFVGVSKDTIRWTLKNYDNKFIERHFILLGKIPYVEVFKYLRDSRIGFNYHPFEKRFLVSIPMKIFEYMMAGLPVVTTELPELKRLLGDESVIFIRAQQPQDYALALLKLLKNPTEATRIGSMSRDLIFNKLNWELSERDKLLNAYKNLLIRRELYEQKINNKC